MLVVALDIFTFDEMTDIVELTKAEVDKDKVGLQLLTAEDPEVIRDEKFQPAEIVDMLLANEGELESKVNTFIISRVDDQYLQSGGDQKV